MVIVSFMFQNAAYKATFLSEEEFNSLAKHGIENSNVMLGSMLGVQVFRPAAFLVGSLGL